jgi:hypothetical protein
LSLRVVPDANGSNSEADRRRKFRRDHPTLPSVQLRSHHVKTGAELIMQYHEALERARSAHPAAPDAEAIVAAVRAFEAFFGPLSAASVSDGLARVYAETLWFNDTLKTITDREQLGRYMTHTAGNVEHCQATVDTWSLTREGDVLVRWTMTIRFKRFARGHDTESMGISLLRLDAAGRIAFQQDFWNAADGLFQYVPILGWAIRAIKRRV